MDKDDPHAIVRDFMKAEIADYQALKSEIRSSFDRPARTATLLDSQRAPEVLDLDTLGGTVTLPFSEASRSFLLEVGRTLSIKRRRDYEKAIERFQSWLAGDPDLSEITPEMAGSFKTALTYYPTDGSKRAAYRGLDFHARVALAKSSGEKSVLDSTTINNKTLGPLRKLFTYHRQSGLTSSLPVNPFDGITVQSSRKNSRKARRDFTNSELISFFKEPLFTGSKGGANAALYISGDVRVSDWRYWVPLICIFTGARLNEVCGLALKDFRNADGIDYIHIRDTVAGQSLKTDAAWRRVPLHAELLRLRLLEFVELRRQQGGERLFDDLQPDASGYFSDRPSKFFNRIVARVADPEPELPGRLVFHSARHTVIGRLRSAGVRKDTSMQIVGHEDSDTHAGYGSIDLAALKTAIDQVVYHGLDLTNVVLPKSVLPRSKP